MKKSIQLGWIENLRAIACLMVILLHVSGHWLYKLNGVDIAVWSSIAIVHTITRFCVPVFIMITGVLLLNRETSPQEFYRIRFARILKPFLFWSVFYISVFMIYDQYNGNVKSNFEVLKFIIWSFISGSAYHLWYLYLLFFLYLVIPFINKIFVKFSNTQVSILVIFWSISLLCAQLFESNIWINKIRMIFGYAGFLVLGYYLNQLKFDKNKTITIAILLMVFGFVFTFFPVYINYVQFRIALENWFYFLNINIVLLASGVFLFIKNFNFRFKFLEKISKHSFGIYFIHLFYIMLLNKLFPIGSMSLPLYVLLTSSVIVILSYFSIKVLTSVPFVSKYIE